MHRTRIKICGVGHVEDAMAAARAGADAVGMIFHPPAGRNVSLTRAGEILAVLPPFVTPVGLFVDQEPNKIREIARSLGLRHIQLHGNEPPEVVADLREFTILKAVRVSAATFGAELDRWRESISRLKLTHLQGLVLETAGVSGGSGRANDWETVRRHRQRGDLIGLPSLIAAGGLTPETVAAVVRDLRPWAVDVSSGVELSPGRKSVQKIEAFVEAVREVGV
ncbi:MAG TPA: phosphoribosylanthranilate isomerase [Tepidisphaeraceae bacterium]|nr:phosphoribosylanthranilate isomerase [Tepidisphaeraceae bacterium]